MKTSLLRFITIALFVAACCVPQLAYATGPYGWMWGLWYVVGILAALVVVALVLSLLILGPVYLVRPSKKHREKMVQLSPGLQKLHAFCHRVAVAAIATLVLVLAGMLIYGQYSSTH